MNPDQRRDEHFSSIYSHNLAEIEFSLRQVCFQESRSEAMWFVDRFALALNAKM